MKDRLTKNHTTQPELLPNNPILSVQDLGRRVEDRWIWSHLSFQVFPGERIAVIGASGSGKSLLLRALAGLDPLQAGQIIFQGQQINSHFMPTYRSQIIYLQQRPALWEGTVEENLQQVYRLAVHRHLIYNRELILNYLHLLHKKPDFLQRPVSALSGGEAQIVAFLRALQLSPAILLLDEPTASLDAGTAQSLEALVTTWQHEHPQRAYLWTSHDPNQLERITNRQITLKDQSEVTIEKSKETTIDNR
ncbi:MULTISPECIES: ATP-binding cassette domain-containing protein [Nostoc]|uniref:ATP-binding cassette domain-containing protein n=1 Tax=Nostoc paludosum FACHB-159 TaxID=2692908 RepID=A0ABR8K7Q5_9NOSO|nr:MULTISPECIES: ATP-binding cassette domain-containing protein [Nostoc]MBD2677456.1 ATP-binding cassette domain-containing protein [Nostoc sp. FACHB-857]MBD2734152.1 ATP-binding cassette domain-containing protein [Nostoc paludosum FACHB-159]